MRRSWKIARDFTLGAGVGVVCLSVIYCVFHLLSPNEITTVSLYRDEPGSEFIPDAGTGAGSREINAAVGVPLPAPSKPAAGVGHEARKISDLGSQLKKLPKGDLVLHAPAKMAVGDKLEVDADVGVGVPIDVLRKKLIPSEQEIEGSLNVSFEMEATLSGPSFTIEPISPIRQTIAQGFPTVWHWSITADKSGPQQLEATLYAIIKLDDKETPQRVNSLTQMINVEVRKETWGEWFDALGRDANTAKGIAVAIASAGSAVLGYFALFRRWRSKRARSPKTAMRT